MNIIEYLSDQEKGDTWSSSVLCNAMLCSAPRTIYLFGLTNFSFSIVFFFFLIKGYKLVKLGPRCFCFICENATTLPVKVKSNNCPPHGKYMIDLYFLLLVGSMEHFWYYFLLNLVNVWGYHNNYFLKYFLFKKLIREYHSVLKLKLKKKKRVKIKQQSLAWFTWESIFIMIYPK